MRWGWAAALGVLLLSACIGDFGGEDTSVVQEESSGECGNGEVEEGELCDDGNTLDGDGCASDCTLGVRPQLGLDWCDKPDCRDQMMTADPLHFGTQEFRVYVEHKVWFPEPAQFRLIEFSAAINGATDRNIIIQGIPAEAPTARVGLVDVVAGSGCHELFFKQSGAAKGEGGYIEMGATWEDFAYSKDWAASDLYTLSGITIKTWLEHPGESVDLSDIRIWTAAEPPSDLQFHHTAHARFSGTRNEDGHPDNTFEHPVEFSNGWLHHPGWLAFELPTPVQASELGWVSVDVSTYDANATPFELSVAGVDGNGDHVVDSLDENDRPLFIPTPSDWHTVYLELDSASANLVNAIRFDLGIPYDNQTVSWGAWARYDNIRLYRAEDCTRDADGTVTCAPPDACVDDDGSPTSCGPAPESPERPYQPLPYYQAEKVECTRSTEIEDQCLANPAGQVRIDGVNPRTGQYGAPGPGVSVPTAGQSLSFAPTYQPGALPSWVGSADVGMGPGWTHNLGMRLHDTRDGFIGLVAQGGSMLRFWKQMDGTFVADLGVFATLEKVPSTGNYWLKEPCSGDKHLFDPGGRLLRSQTAAGKLLSYKYWGTAKGAAEGRLRAVEVGNYDGRSLELDYDASTGKLTSVTDPLGNAHLYRYDADGRLTSVEQPDGGVFSYGYDTENRLTSVTDPLGQTVQTTYDANGRVASRIHPDATTTAFAYLDETETEVTDGLGRTTSYGFDFLGRLGSITDPSGQATALSYDMSHNLARVTNRLGQTASLTHNEYGQVLSVSDVANRHASYEYDAWQRLIESISPSGAQTVYEYDSTVAPPRDPVKIILRDRDQTTVLDEWSLSYTGGNLTSIVDGAGVVTRFSYDNHGNQVSVEKDGYGGTVFQTRREFDAVGNLVAEVNAAGARTEYDYDAQYRVTAIRQLAGTAKERVWRLAYDDAGQLVETESPLGLIQTRAYDAHGRLLAIDEPLMASEEAMTAQFAYDEAGHLIATIDASGKETQLVYDPAAGHDLPVQRIVAPGTSLQTTESWSYDAEGKPLNYTDPQGAVTQYVYDGDTGSLATIHRVATEAFNNDRFTHFEYDAAGNLEQVRDSTGRFRCFTYDVLGRRLREVRGDSSYDTCEDPEDVVRSWSWGPAGQLLSETEYRSGTTGYTTIYQYDAVRGLLASVTDPLGNATSFGYDAMGRRTRLTDATGVTGGVAYDGIGRVTKTWDGTGAETLYSYEAGDRPVAVADPLGNTTTMEYDLHGLLTRAIDPLGVAQTWQYENGRLNGRNVPSSFTDGTHPGPYFHFFQFSYDGLGQLVQVDEGNSSDDLIRQSTQYAWDAAGRLTQVVDPAGNETTYGYDSLGNLRSVTDPLARVTQMQYDRAGRLVSRTSAAGDGFSLVYDTLGRVQNVRDLSSALVASYVYDKAGRRASMSDSQGSTTYTYDDAGRLARVDAPLSSALYGGGSASPSVKSSLLYEYDAAGRMTRRTARRANGTSVSYDYTYHQGRLAKLVGPEGTTNYYYDAAGRPVSVSHDGGRVQTYAGYDAAGRLSNLTHQMAGGDSLSFALSRDAAGRIVRQVRQDAGMQSAKNFAYDELNRLRAAWSDDGSQSWLYGYDFLNNRTLQQTILNGETGYESYTYNAGQELTSITTAECPTCAGTTEFFSYDPAGRLLSDGEQAYEYDTSGRLARLVPHHTALLPTSFQYNGDGLRALATTGSEIQGLIWDSSGGLAEPALRVHGDGQSVVFTEATRKDFGVTVTYPDLSAPTLLPYLGVKDPQGSVVLADADGSWAGETDYTPYGRPMDAPGKARVTDLQPFGYTGELQQDGLVYLRARDYQPRTGRFTSVDPFPGFAQMPGTVINPYTYVLNDPVNLTDPSGEIAPIVAGMAAGAVFGGALYAYQHRDGGFSWKGMAAATAGGAVGGAFVVPAALTGSAMALIGYGALGGAAGMGTEQLLNNLLEGCPLSHGMLEALAWGVGSGALGGGLGYGGGKLARWALRPLWQRFGGSMGDVFQYLARAKPFGRELADDAYLRKITRLALLKGKRVKVNLDADEFLRSRRGPNVRGMANRLKDEIWLCQNPTKCEVAHEFGHLLGEQPSNLRGSRTNEIEAWKWALENGRLAPQDARFAELYIESLESGWTFGGAYPNP